MVFLLHEVIDVHERIKKLRKTLDLTQQEFCSRIGLQRNSISLVESGKRNISNQAILSICREFNVNETWLRTGEGEMFVQMTRSQEIAEFVGKVLQGEEDNFKRRFIAMLSRLDEDDWAVLEKMVNDMKKD